MGPHGAPKFLRDMQDPMALQRKPMKIEKPQLLAFSTNKALQDLCKIKIGSVVFNSLGKSFLKEVSSRGFKIFLDLKLHDIPNTVHEANVSVKEKTIAEFEVDEDEWEDYLWDEEA